MADLDTAMDSDVQLKWGVKIPLRDGVRLSATLYLPDHPNGRSPALFTLTPYIGQSCHEYAKYFASCGYPFLAVDVRGRGNSEGEFRPFIQESLDGYDVVEWLSQQAYCDGRVAMWGGSYGGHAQWVTAAQVPPHLGAIVPAAAPHIGLDMPISKNIPAPYLMRWLTLVSGRTSQEKIFRDGTFWASRFREWFESGTPFQQLDTFLGNPSAVFQEWMSHPHQGPYWDRYNPDADQYQRLTIPVLTLTGAYDGNQPGALMHYRHHMQYAPVAARARHYLVIGPWDHEGTRTPKAEFGGIKVGSGGLIDLQRLHVEWYRWTLGGQRKPDFLQKRVAYYVMGAEMWRYVDSLDSVTAAMHPLYLRSSANPTDIAHAGTLTPERPSHGEPDYYVYDPRDISLAALESSLDPENRRDQRLIDAAAGRQLVYHSAPLEADLEISGFFTLSAWLAIDQPDTDFRASVYEIDENGDSLLLTTDWIRARYRESLREPAPIRTQEPLRYDFQRFTFVSRLLRGGSRLRLVIGPVSSIYRQKNYNSGGVVAEESAKDAQPVRVRLFHDSAHPSALYVPHGQTEE